eukprot:GEMP01006869.1.p1 GENE.GEMP01006869.1~~GEMP01006869.1.p1  ORF type:complete len:517 (+),score=52.57 GEMP01006869.1:287-1837(+)
MPRSPWFRRMSSLRRLGVNFPPPRPIRQIGTQDDFPLNRVLEDVFCAQPNKIGMPVCLRIIPILWSCILFGHIFMLVQPQMQDAYYRTTYVLAVSLDVWFRFTYCTLWIVNEERTKQAKVCCMVSFICGALEFLAIATLVTYYFEKVDTKYIWISKVAALCQCLLQTVTLYLARRIVDVAHVTGAVILIFFITMTSTGALEFLSSPSVMYICIVSIPALTSVFTYSGLLMEKATSSVYNFIGFILCILSTILKYTHVLFLCVFANNQAWDRDYFIYRLGNDYPGVFNHYRERALITTLFVLAVALVHLWKSGEFSTTALEGFEVPCEYEARLSSPMRCSNKKFSVTNSSVHPVSAGVTIPGCSSELEECIICFDKTRTVILEPCQHLVACTECSARLVEKQSNPSCPLCRVSVTALLMCTQDAEDRSFNILTCHSRRAVIMCRRSMAESSRYSLGLNSFVIPPNNDDRNNDAPPESAQTDTETRSASPTIIGGPLDVSIDMETADQSIYDAVVDVA